MTKFKPINRHRRARKFVQNYDRRFILMAGLLGLLVLLIVTYK